VKRAESREQRAESRVMRIAMATTRPLPEPDPDEEMTLDAFRRAGYDVELLAWDGGATVEGFDAVVLRSTWDYYLSLDRFVAWLESVASVTRLVNPLPIVWSNLHKRYLLELRRRGVPVVATALVGRGVPVELPEKDDAPLFVKPAVGASSWKARAFRYGGAFGYVQELAQEMDVLVQPFLPSVEDSGERSLVWIAGEFTHKVIKRARFEGHDESVSGGLPVEDEERRVGMQALSAYAEWAGGELPLYARVDLMQAEDGALLVSEVELTEPSLYFLQHPPALERFVAALGERLRA
jgi:hypothetical protein